MQGSGSGEDGVGIWRTGGARDGNSDRGRAALAMPDVSGLDAPLPIWLRSKDPAMRSVASIMGIGGVRPPEFRLKASVHSEGRTNVGTRRGSGWNR